MPGDGTSLAVISRQDLEIEHIDDTVVVQVCRREVGGVIVHADGHGIELIDDIVVVDIARNQLNVRLGNGRAAGQCDRTFRGEIPMCNGDQCIGPGRSREREGIPGVGGNG